MSTHRGDGHVLDIILSDDLEQRRRLVRPNDPRPVSISSTPQFVRRTLHFPLPPPPSP